MEDKITFETAKLAKEKGLPSEFGYGYYPDGGKITLFRGTPPIYAPTQTVLQKWLREVYNIDVSVIPKYKDLGKFYGGFIDTNNGEMNKSYGSNFKIYEEALEKGLYQALLLIK
jgi:hypothetical protein